MNECYLVETTELATESNDHQWYAAVGGTMRAHLEAGES